MPKLVALSKGASGPSLAQLDPRGAFVVHTSAATFIWRGALCPPDFAVAAERAARQLVRFEGAPQPVLHVVQVSDLTPRSADLPVL